ASNDNQMGLINTKLPIDPQVCLTFSHHSDPRPLVDEPVRFTVAAGGGTVGGGPSTVVRTGSTGCASAPWVLGSTTVAAGNRLTATAARFSPAPVAGGVAFAALSAGNNGAGGHICGVTTSGAAYCWGHNGNGQLGDGTTTDRLVPTPVAGGVTFAALSAGGQHTCGVTPSGAAYCWGFNGAGGLGDGTTTQRLVPTLVAGGVTFAALSAGEAHTCGVTTSGVVYCWGLNGNGQVGDGTTTNRLVPTAVAFATGPIPDISGTYAGTVSGANTDGSGVFSGPAAFQFVQTGAAITGTWSSSAGNDPATGTLNGTINGSVVTLTFTETAPCPDSFTGSGTITNGGASIS